MTTQTHGLAVAYCRISEDKTGAMLGVERQAEDCRKLSLQLGLSEPEILTDNDMSAFSGKRRPGYEQLKAGLREGRWQHLIIWHVDRLTRSARDLEDVVDLVNGKVSVHTVQGGEIDLETPEGRLTARMFGSLARYESEHRGQRVLRALAQNADRGIDSGGQRRYGWNDDGTVEPAEAAIVLELTSRVVRGESCRSLAADLRTREVPSARGATWSAGAVKAIVVRARNAGLVERHVRGQSGGEVLGAGNWSPIVPREQWEAARALLTDPSRRLSPGNAPARLLSGLMTCGKCGAPVRSGGQAAGAIYRCSASAHLTRRAEFVDDFVSAHIYDLLQREEVAVVIAHAGTSDLRDQIDAARLLLEKLEDKFVDDQISHAAYIRNHDRLSTRLADLERQQALSIVPGVMEGVSPEMWLEGPEQLPLERRRAIVADRIDVVLMPASGRREDVRSIKITPKQQS